MGKGIIFPLIKTLVSGLALSLIVKSRATLLQLIIRAAYISLLGINNTILSNSIYSNGGISSDLDVDSWSPSDGVTPNDPGDSDGADAGSNHLQNFPVLASATLSDSSTTVLGSLNSAANRNYTLQFFSSDACDSTGYGQGQTLIGSTVVITNGSGDATFDLTLPAVAAGSFITSTATDDANNTSEFSECHLKKLNISLAGDGLGTVAGNPGGINCGAACSAFFPPGTVVALSAMSNFAWSYFAGWSGDPDARTGR